MSYEQVQGEVKTFWKSGNVKKLLLNYSFWFLDVHLVKCFFKMMSVVPCKNKNWFLTQIELLPRLNHQNLVSLIEDCDIVIFSI